MSDCPPSNPENLTAMQEAALWLNRRQETSSEQEEEQFHEWLDASEENRQAYSAVQRAWRVAGVARDTTATKRLREEALQYRPKRRRLAWPQYAAAAAVVIVAGIVGQAVLPLSGVQEAQQTAAVEQRIVETAAGERQVLTLGDGTIITLNAESRIALSTEPSARHASLLAGEALFEVTKDPEHPFIVDMDGYQVRVLGTVFNVRLSDENVKVALAEGRIEFAHQAEDAIAPKAAQHIKIKPGQQLVADTSGITISDVDVEDIMMWQKERIQFKDTPVPEALKEMARYSRTPVEVADADISEYRVSGTFSTSQPETFITALTEVFPLTATPEGEKVIIRKAEKK